nr:sensor histidine kinase [uncultured Chitinophaga sp.]
MLVYRHPIVARLYSKVPFYHLVGWGLFILYEVSFVAWLVGTTKNRSIFIDYLFPYIINIGLFYTHAHITLSLSFGSGKRPFLFLLLTLAELALYLSLIALINVIADGTHFHFPAQWTKAALTPLLLQLWRGLYFMGLSSAYWFAIKSIESHKKVLMMEKREMQNQVEKNNLEKSLVEMQNAYLQAQINPHLLFNTLNFVYNNVQQVSREASDAIILLSELMNYTLQELEPDGKVKLEKEVEQIKNIIRINQIRFNNKLYLDVDFNEDFKDTRILPMGLIPFIENVFKHADLTNKDNPGRISINSNSEFVEMVTLNRKKKRSKAYSHGIGMANAIKRLDNLYRKNYTLNVKNEDDDFYLHLVIKLNTDPND